MGRPVRALRLYREAGEHAAAAHHCAGALAGAVATGDFAPTDQAREVQVILNERVMRYRAEVDELLRTDVARFNRMLRGRSMTPVISALD